MLNKIHSLHFFLFFIRYRKEKVRAAMEIIINCTPEQDGAIIKREEWLTYPARGWYSKEIPDRIRTHQVVGARIHRR